MKFLLVVYDNDSYCSWMPQGLAYIASVIRSSGNEVVFWNQDIHHYKDEELTKYLDENEFDFVGLSIIGGYYQYRKCLSLSNAINNSKNRNKFKYILGGHLASPESEYFLKKTQADIIVIGEGEETISELINKSFKCEGVKGIAYREGERVFINERRELIKDIDSISMPAYDLLPMSVYRLLRMPNCNDTDFVMPMLSGRGCIYNCNFCFDENMLIFTDEGVKKIKEVVEKKVGNNVLSHDGTWNEIENRIVHLYDGKMLEIKARGILPIIVTLEHPFIVDGKEIEAKDLKLGDFLDIGNLEKDSDIEYIDIYEELKDYKYVIKYQKRISKDIVDAIFILHENGFSNIKVCRLLNISRSFVIDVLKNKHNLVQKEILIETDLDNKKIKLCNGKWTDRYIKLDKKFFRLAGLFIAEGCVVKCKNRTSSYTITFNYSYKEENLAKETKKLLKECLNIDSFIIKVDSSIRVSFSNNIIGLLFIKLFGKLAHNKKIPFEWMNLPKEKMDVLLNSYYEGDGYKRKERVYSNEAATTSITLAYQIMMICSRNNIYVSFSKKDGGISYIQERKVNTHDSYHLYISDYNKFGNKKREILSIKEIDVTNKLVYNLSIKDKNTYIVNGIQTHNCYRLDKGFRPRSSKSIIEEVKFLKEKYEITYIVFSDELLMSSKDRTRELCEEFLINDLNIKFSCNGRLNFASEDVLRIMKKSGCVYLNYGIESCDDVVLKNMKKCLTYKKIVEGVENTLKVGISPGLNILFGNIGDSEKTLLKSVDFLLKYDDRTTLRTIRPVVGYPGTDLFKLSIEKGFIRNVEDFYENRCRNSDLFDIHFMEGINIEEANKLLCEANKILIKNYYDDKKKKTIDIAEKLYYNNNINFRGFR